MTMRRIERAAVLGAGVMGAALAAHLANVGIDVLLLDLPTGDGNRDARADAGLAAAVNAHPPSFYAPRFASRVRTGNFEDDLSRVTACDWVIEAVTEDLAIKRGLYERLAPHVADHAVVSSNTSGLSVAALSEALPEPLRPRFLVTHFFNPPRYLDLLEIVPGPQTSPEILTGMSEFGSRVLGKGIVLAKDTPNFIANRVGVFSVFHILHHLPGSGLTLAEIDKLTGPVIGRPRSATFRTIDLVGLDTLARVARNLHDRLPNDPHRDLFAPPALLEQLIERGALGAKSGTGFYRKARRNGERVILMLDPASGEYVEQGRVRLPALSTVQGLDGVGDRLRALVNSNDPAGTFLWGTLSATLCYAAECVPEIADDPTAIDHAMRWGFGWQLGPFEMWDALGVAATVDRLAAEQRPIPALVQALLGAGESSFYARSDSARSVFGPGGRRPVVRDASFVVLDDLRAAGKTVLESPDARLLDLGDDVACLAFATKMNTIGPGVIAMIERSLDEVESRWRGLVLGTDATDLCAGANLHLILTKLSANEYDDVERMVARFQRATSRMRFAARPVVVAACGLALGGGCELVLGADAVVAAAESYIGLVEVGAGVIPAGGGCKELIRRVDEALPHGPDVDLFPHVRRVFETVGLAKVSTSAALARDLGFLRSTDQIVVNARRVLHVAKQRVLALDQAGYEPPRARVDIRVAGEVGLAALRAGLHNMVLGGFASEYDALVGDKLASVLCGGDVSASSRVSESYLLELEREAFMSLCGNEQTRSRMRHLLETGKPLRN